MSAAGSPKDGKALGHSGLTQRIVATPLFYGIGLLVMHAIVGTHAKVSLGSFPPLLAVVTAIVSMFIAAGGGRIARGERAKAGIVFPDPRDER